MSERVSDEQVEDLATVLRKDVTVDAKVQVVTAIKSSIKQHNVPDACVAPLFEALRLASTSSHTSLVSAGFTALNHLLTRLSRQEPKYITKEAKHTLPLIIDKLGDAKDKYRALASQALTTMYDPAPLEVERFVRNTAMVGKNARAKEAGMLWVLQMHQDHGMQFRAYVPILMELLEDADGMVRDTAKTTVIDLFRDAPNGAKSDLKRQLKNFKVRPAIESAIIKELTPTRAPSRPASRMDGGDDRPHTLAASTSSVSLDRPQTPAPPEAKVDPVEPSYVNTNRELDDEFKAMHPWFEGKETEQNWLAREKSCTRLRRLIAGNATDFSESFIGGCRALLDGIIKAASSLRTSLSKEGCALVQDLANAFGPAIDAMVELLMQTFIKLCAATKKIASQLANTTVDTIIGKATYNARIMQHVWLAVQDKNVQPRTYATGWLKTLIKKESTHKNHFEHTGGLDLLEKAIKKGLADSNAGVREKMRSTYWAFAAVWPARAQLIMDGLEGTAQKLLQKAPDNPHSPKMDAPALIATRAGMGLSKSAMITGSKPSLREAMLAQKRALTTTKNLPARPGSAMATVTTSRSVSNTSHAGAATNSSVSRSNGHAAAPATRPKAEATTLSHGGMSHAPMRPTRRRPDLIARPATAGPYSGRNNESLQSSPTDSKSRPGDTPKPTATDTSATSPRRTIPRSKTGHVPAHSESSIASPSRVPTAAKTLTSPRVAHVRTSPAKTPSATGTPVKATPASNGVTAPSGISMSSPARANEDLTMLMPSFANKKEGLQASPVIASSKPSSPVVLRDHAVPEGAVLSTPSKSPLKVYEDPVTDDEVKALASTDGSSDRPALEDRPVNEDGAKLGTPNRHLIPSTTSTPSDKSPQNARILDSGIARIKSQSLDIHGFRRLQSLIRDNKASLFADDKLDALIAGLFNYLASPLPHLAADKVQDVKTQILATVKLLLKKARGRFQPHVTNGLDALLAARSRYDARTHIVSGLELLADDLVAIGDPDEIAVTMTKKLRSMDKDAAGCRSLSMGLHVLKRLMETRGPAFAPKATEVESMAALALRCLESRESAVRMDAVQLCVALHARVGEPAFWASMKGVRDDPKSLITYYVVKRQREGASVAS